MTSFQETVSFIWGVADLIRDTFSRGKYKDVIFPLTLIRRVDQVLADTRPRVRERHEQLKQLGIADMDQQLRRASGFAFYNTYPQGFADLLGSPQHLYDDFRAYLNAFSPNMREVIEKFDFYPTIDRLREANLLFKVLERFSQIDLHPSRVPNEQMGQIFEELLRKFNEATNENPGEHFTPREVVRLMTRLLIAGDTGNLDQPGVIRRVYDPCCGTGGMLVTARQQISERNPQATVFLYGQEVNPETYAVCKADLFMISKDGKDADNIAFGSTLANDQHADEQFHYLLANPPYGKDWKADKDAVEAEANRSGRAGRFGVGLPRISDGQLLFLLHMLARMQPQANGGARVAIIMNGSPLFTGDAGSGESKIRRYVCEHDLLEAIIALPEQLFYNTGIATYVWVLTNTKPPHRRGTVQLINATGTWTPMRKSLGDKRREINAEQIEAIVQLYQAGADVPDLSLTLPTTAFGYRKITIERPLRLRVRITAERLAQLAPTPKLLPARTPPDAQAAWLADLRAALLALPHNDYDDCAAFHADLAAALHQRGAKKLSATQHKALLDLLAERDPTAQPGTDDKGTPLPDPDLRDTEQVPLAEDVESYFAREVAPHLPDAWINRDSCDAQDGQVGTVGYEINFNRYFYRYTPPRPLAHIEADLHALEADIVRLLREVLQP
ncbi:MAG: SAM-dependent DNA methyltransferase [Chloroflexaceae bacterium]|nr:SAM-dependent DNA methyltransferase [Chloroflexaceae bacterium]